MDQGRRGILSVDPKRILSGMLWAVLCIALVSLSLRGAELFWGWHPTRKFDLDSEANVPNSISAFLLVAASALFWCIGCLQQSVSVSMAKPWKMLSILWVIFALDEATALHESLNGFFGRRLELTGAFHWGWVIAGLLFVPIFLTAFSSLGKRLPKRTLRIMLGAFAIYFGSSVGLEMVSAKAFVESGASSVAYHLLATLEESGELAGTILLIYSLLDYIGTYAGTMRFVWANGVADAAAVELVQRSISREIAVGQPALTVDPWKGR